MATPMVLFPQTNEQSAVARRVSEIGAGILLKDDSVSGISTAVKKILSEPSYAESAEECSADFRSCSGFSGTADFIESAPHTSDGRDIMKELSKANIISQVIYNIAVSVIGVILFNIISPKLLPVYVTAVILLSFPFRNIMQNINYGHLVKRMNEYKL